MQYRVSAEDYCYRLCLRGKEWRVYRATALVSEAITLHGSCVLIDAF